MTPPPCCHPVPLLRLAPPSPWQGHTAVPSSTRSLSPRCPSVCQNIPAGLPRPWHRTHTQQEQPQDGFQPPSTHPDSQRKCQTPKPVKWTKRRMLPQTPGYAQAGTADLSTVPCAAAGSCCLAGAFPCPFPRHLQDLELYTVASAPPPCPALRIPQLFPT